MTVKIHVKHDFEALAKSLGAVPDQVRFASAHALTQTAKDIKAAEEHEMRDVFDRPTRYTMTSVFMKSATKANLEATVWLKDDATKAIPATKFLQAQIEGGTRRMKRFEKALQAVGAMPQGYMSVPGEAARLDADGNMSRGQIVQILSYFKAFPEDGIGFKSNMNDKGRERLAKGTRTRQGFSYFVGAPGGRLPLGIWQRVRFAQGSAVKPVLIFVEAAAYKAIFDFKYVADMTFEKNFDKNFKAAVDLAMRTRRPQQ